MLPAKSLKLVDTLRIGPRCGVYLVQAEAHRVLVGVEHGKTMCLMPLPEQFSESLDAAETDAAGHEQQPAAGFERVADVFSARRTDERAKGATS
jgi:flagellar biogenesis protein FliO